MLMFSRQASDWLGLGIVLSVSLGGSFASSRACLRNPKAGFKIIRNAFSAMVVFTLIMMNWRWDLWMPDVSHRPDIEMWMRLASRYDVAYVPEPLIVISPREHDHLLKRYYWWEKTVDVRVKRMALRILRPRSGWGRLRFELRARWQYAWSILPPLYHGRWRDVAMGFYLTLTGRDELPPPP